MPSPTSLSFAGVTDGVLSFYAATAGREAASLLAFNLDAQSTAAGDLTGGDLAGGSGQSTGSVLTATTTGVFQQAAQLLGLNGSALDLIAPLLTVSVVPGDLDAGAHGEAEIALLANFLPSTSTTVAQRPALPQNTGGSAGETAEKGHEKPQDQEDAEADLPIWARLASGLEQAWELLRANMLKREGIDLDAANQAAAAPGHKAPEPAPGGAGGQRQVQPQPGRSQTGLAPLIEVPPQDTRPGKQTALDIIDAAIVELAEEPFSGYRHEDQRLVQPIAAAITLTSVENLARWIRSTRVRRRTGWDFAGASGV